MNPSVWLEKEGTDRGSAEDEEADDEANVDDVAANDEVSEATTKSAPLANRCMPSSPAAPSSFQSSSLSSSPSPHTYSPCAFLLWALLLVAAAAARRTEAANAGDSPTAMHATAAVGSAEEDNDEEGAACALETTANEDVAAPGRRKSSQKIQRIKSLLCCEHDTNSAHITPHFSYLNTPFPHSKQFIMYSCVCLEWLTMNE
jgi:hypothetical protein